MKKDKTDKIDVNPIMAQLSLEKFKIWHAKYLKHDKLTAEKRYAKIGGKVK